MSSVHKKIIIDARFLGTATGIGRYVEGLVRELEGTIPPLRPPLIEGGNIEKIDFVVLVSKDGWENWEPKNPRFRKKLVNARWYTVREQFALWRALREEKPDLVHFPHWNICYFWKGPFVVTIHDLILLEYPTRRASKLGAVPYWIKYKLLFPLILRKAIYDSRKIIVPSNYTKESIIKYFPKISAEKIEVIYEGAPSVNPKHQPPNSKQIPNPKSQISDFRLPPETTNYKLQTTNYLLYVGNALPHKNLEFLVRVFKRLKEFTPSSSFPFQGGEWGGSGDLKLILVGEPSYFYNRLKRYINEIGLKFVEAKLPFVEVSHGQNDVIFSGRLSDEELYELYKNARAYVFPSLLEGFGLPPLEAMAESLPVAAANSSCLPEVLGEAALYFDPHDENDAVEKISYILTDEKLRTDLIDEGREQVKRYDWGKMARKTLEIYRSPDLIGG